MAALTDAVQILDPADPFLTRVLDPSADTLELNVPLTLNRDTTINANLTINGTLTATDEERVLIQDGYPYLNNGYTNPVAKTGGLVVNVLPSVTSDTVNGAFVAGVLATSNPVVTTAGSNTFSTGDFIQISGAADPGNDGLYEVLSHVGTALEIRGVGVTAAQESFTQTDFTADATAQGTITKLDTVSILRANASGVWESAAGGSSPTGTPLTFTALGGGAAGLDPNYQAGNTITTDAANGSVTIGGTEAFIITATGGLNVDTVADFDVSVFDVQMTGANGFSIDGTAASNLSVANGNLTLAATGAGSDVILSAADLVDIDGTTLDLDASGAATLDAGTTLGLTGGTGATMTATAGQAQITAPAGEVDITANTVVDINGATLDVDTTGDAAITSGATLDLDGATVDMDSTAATTIDAGTTLGLTGATGATLSATANNATVQAPGGNVVLNANAVVDIDGASLDADITGAAEIDAQSLSLDATASSNLTVAGNSGSATDLTLSATNAGAGTGNVLVAADDEIDLTSTTLDMNVATGQAAAATLSAGGTDFFTADSTSGAEQLVTGTFLNVQGTAGVRLTATPAVTAGDVLTLNASGEVEQADASAAALDGLSVGIALRSAGAGADVDVVTVPGCLVPVRFAVAPAGANNRRPVYVSGTPGLATLTPPTGSGTTRFLLGYLQGADGVTTTPTIIYQPQYLSRTP